MHSTVIIVGDMIDDWLDDRIIEPEEHGVVAKAINPPPVEAAIAINATNSPGIVLHVV